MLQLWGRLSADVVLGRGVVTVRGTCLDDLSHMQVAASVETPIQ